MWPLLCSVEDESVGELEREALNVCNFRVFHVISLKFAAYFAAKLG